MNLIKSLYTTLVQGNQKAITGFALTFVIGLGLQIGGTNIVDLTVGEVLTAGVGGLINAAGVWLKTNRK